MINAAEVLVPFEDEFAPQNPRQARSHEQRHTVNFFEEQQLVFDMRKKEDHVPSRIASELIAASTPEARMANIRSMLSVLGFNFLQYEAVQNTNDGGHEHYFLKTYVPGEWANQYARKHYCDLDPRVSACLGSPFPFVWDLQYFLKARLFPPHDARTRGFLEDMARAGMCSGISFGFINPATHRQVVVGFNSANPSKNWITTSVVGQALILGLSIHEFISGCIEKLMHHPDLDAVSDIQKQILECLANGLSDKEIARNLKTTYHNVDYHLRYLRKKYGATNRAQLAYMIGRLAIV
jgi:DNA-binding CsgD family transcriptional regulator